MGTLALLMMAMATPGVVRADTLPPPPARAPALPLHGPRPAAIVAARVRSVLGDHRDSHAWRELAGVLPEMALVGGADLEGTFEAARLADSISSAPEGAALDAPLMGEVRGAPARTAGSEAGTDGTGWRVLPVEARPVAAAMVVAALLGAATLARRRSPRRSQPAREKRGRVWAARSLASSGMSAREIARRTGMAQDAVHVLLGLAERSPASRPSAVGGGPRTSPSRPSNSARRLDSERDRLKAEISGGARRLLDGRLTYGGGR